MSATDTFFQALDGRNRLNDQGVKRLIKQKLSVYSSLQDKVKSLEDQLNDAKSTLRRLASEYISLGLMGLQNTEDTTPALQNFEKALSIDPENPDALRGKAKALVGIGENESGLETYLRLIKSGEPQANDYIETADLYASFGETYGALDYLIQASELDKNNPVICDRLADIYTSIGEDDEADRYTRLARKLRRKKK